MVERPVGLIDELVSEVQQKACREGDTRDKGMHIEIRKRKYRTQMITVEEKQKECGEGNITRAHYSSHNPCGKISYHKIIFAPPLHK